MFLDTVVKGCKLPGHVNFEEVNLRFYVKNKEKRGVVFIREIVPRPVITTIANRVYKEHYQTLPMKHEWIKSDNELKIKYIWYTDHRENLIAVEAESKPMSFLPGSKEEFITEHYWGYTKVNEYK